MFEGTNWTAAYILGRLLWSGIGFIFLLAAVKIFHRFDVKERIISKKKKSTGTETEKTAALKDIHRGALPTATPNFGILSFIKIELKMLLRKGPEWF